MTIQIVREKRNESRRIGNIQRLGVPIYENMPEFIDTFIEYDGEGSQRDWAHDDLHGVSGYLAGHLATARPREVALRLSLVFPDVPALIMGDSFRQWAEPLDALDDEYHVVIYSRTEDRLIYVAEAMYSVLSKKGLTISEGHDWSVQYGWREVR